MNIRKHKIPKMLKILKPVDPNHEIEKSDAFFPFQNTFALWLCLK